jgi:hypothetical protein
VHVRKVVRPERDEAGVIRERMPEVDHTPEQDPNDSEAYETAARKHVLTPERTNDKAVRMDIQGAGGVEAHDKIPSDAKDAAFWSEGRSHKQYHLTKKVSGAGHANLGKQTS